MQLLHLVYVNNCQQLFQLSKFPNEQITENSEISAVINCEKKPNWIQAEVSITLLSTKIVSGNLFLWSFFDETKQFFWRTQT